MSAVAELVVAEDLAAETARRFLESSPRLVALAGGSTPRPLYERLAATEYPWADVDVIPTDERCVPEDHPDSNLGMIRRTLLEKVDARVHPLGGEPCDAEAADQAVRRALGGRSLDLAVLGLGADGHTASLFPGHPGLDEGDRLVVRVERPDHPRLSLTIPVLSAAAVALFVVAGASKREALHRLLAGEDVPAARVTAGRVLVVADRAAAGWR